MALLCKVQGDRTPSIIASKFEIFNDLSKQRKRSQDPYFFSGFRRKGKRCYRVNNERRDKPTFHQDQCRTLGGQLGRKAPLHDHTTRGACVLALDSDLALSQHARQRWQTKTADGGGRNILWCRIVQRPGIRRPKQIKDYRMGWDDVRGMDQTFSVQRRKNLQTTFPNVLGRARAHRRSTCEVVYRSGFLYTYIKSSHTSVLESCQRPKFQNSCA